MGWNGSGQKGATPAQPKKVTPKKPSPIRGLVAGLVVVVLTGAAYFAFFVGSEKPQVEKSTKERGRIKEVTPAKAPTNKDVEVRKPFEYVRRGNDIIGKNGKPLLPAARVAIERMLNKPKIVFEADPPPPNPRHIFQHDAENLLADWMDVEPGQHVHMAEFSPTLEKDFRDSIADPIHILPTDTPEQAELKKAMIETKKQIAVEMGKGKTFLEVLDDYRKELNRTADAHNMCQQEMEKMLRDGAPKEEIEAFLQKANDLIGQDGCLPMQMNKSFLSKLAMRDKAKLLKEKAKQQQ